MITLSGFPNNGALGNQLFQLAAAYALAKRVGTQVTVPKWANDYLFPHIWRYLRKGQAAHSRQWKDKQDLSFAEIPLQDNMQLWGYFQSEKFFADCADDIRAMFACNLLGESKPPNIIALHVRGGDYRRLRHTYKEIDAAYYAEAIRLSGCNEVHLFSDDNQYAYELLTKGGVQVDKIMGGTRDSAFGEMSSYQYLATCNSTFGWWSGYLNPNPDATIYAPSKWFNTIKLTERDIIPTRFTVIHNG